MRDDGFVDLSCSSIPKRHGPPFSTPWAVHGVPRSPLLPGHRPTVSKANDILHLALAANGELYISIQIALARPFHSPIVRIGIVVFVNVDQLETCLLYTS